MIPVSVLVSGIWGIILAITVSAIGVAVYAGFKRDISPLAWRRAKLISAVSGLVGLLFFLLNFETTLREIIGVRSKEYVQIEFLDLKHILAEQVAIACAHERDSQQSKLTCFDLKNIDNGLLSSSLRDARPFEKIVNWQRNPDIDQFANEVNSRVDRINQAIPAASETHSFLSDDNHIRALLTASIFLIVSLAISIGDAIFQLRQPLLQTPETFTTTISPSSSQQS